MVRPRTYGIQANSIRTIIMHPDLAPRADRMPGLSKVMSDPILASLERISRGCKLPLSDNPRHLDFPPAS
jgi:hypothetical protein